MGTKLILTKTGGDSSPAWQPSPAWQCPQRASVPSVIDAYERERETKREGLPMREGNEHVNKTRDRN